MSCVVIISLPFLSASSLQGICTDIPADSTVEYCIGLSPRCRVPCQIVVLTGSAATNIVHSIEKPKAGNNRFTGMTPTTWEFHEFSESDGRRDTRHQKSGRCA